MNISNPGYALHSFSRQLRIKAQTARHRYCLILSGSQIWGQESAQLVCDQFLKGSTLWVNFSDGLLITGDGVKTLKASQAKTVLGGETEMVVYNCFSGFDPNAVGILGGTIKAGGFMILMTPGFTHWPDLDDPLREKITPYGNPTPKSSLYLKRLIRIIPETANCVVIEQDKPLPNLPVSCESLSSKLPDFSEQNQAIQSVKHVMNGQRRRPIVLLSDRGRGKSAALGIAASQLLQGKVKRIGVTGNSKQSVANVFKHAVLGDKHLTDSLCYIPADKLVESKADIELLLVDEAASIPISMLGQILKTYPRIAFASTVHGYEGTGRGFLLRFTELLDTHCRGWKTLSLSTPIRWAENDPLESFLFDALLLDAEPSRAAIQNVEIPRLEFRDIEKEDLIKNEPLTRDVFGLLTQAHYRTRPNDLRHLLDAANLKLFGIYQQEQLLGVAVVATEGGFDDEFAKKIWANQSRPNGHLFPELLCAQQGLLDAAKLKTARIMRIVVHPKFQRRGIGKYLLAHIFNYYEKKVDLVGTTFGAGLAIVRFWLNCQFKPVRIGHTQSHNTGTHPWAMLKPISKQGQQLAVLAQNKFIDNFRYQLNSILTSIDPALVPLIYKSTLSQNTVELDNNDLMDLTGFAFANRNMGNMLGSLHRLTENAIQLNSLNQYPHYEILLVERILLGKSWKNCTALENPKGKKQGVAELRKIVRTLLNSLHPKQTEWILKDFDLRA